MVETIQHPPCSKCGQVDDHPRHIVIRVLDVRPLAPEGADNDTLAKLEAIYNTADHIDCCTCHNDSGVTGVESCADIAARAGGRKGEDLRAHLVDNPRRVDN